MALRSGESTSGYPELFFRNPFYHISCPLNAGPDQLIIDRLRIGDKQFSLLEVNLPGSARNVIDNLFYLVPAMLTVHAFHQKGLPTDDAGRFLFLWPVAAPAAAAAPAAPTAAAALLGVRAADTGLSALFCPVQVKNDTADNARKN